MEGSQEPGQPPENPAANPTGEPQAEQHEDSQPEESKPDSGSGVKYYQGKPVQVIGGQVFPLPAAIPVGEDALTDSAEDYDAGAEAAASTTAETQGVTSQNV